MIEYEGHKRIFGFLALQYFALEEFQDYLQEQNLGVKKGSQSAHPPVRDWVEIREIIPSKLYCLTPNQDFVSADISNNNTNY